MKTSKHESDLVFLDEEGYLVTPAVNLKIDEFSGMVLSYEFICKVICKLEVTPESPRRLP
jgi:hypothetical protein